MSKIIFLITILLSVSISGCASNSDFAAYNELLNNFTYKSTNLPGETVATQKVNIQKGVNKKLIGDCDDFAFTLKSRVGGEVWYTFVGSVPHAVLVKDGIAFDYLTGPTRNYPYRLLFEIRRQSHISHSTVSVSPVSVDVILNDV